MLQFHSFRSDTCKWVTQLNPVFLTSEQVLEKIFKRVMLVLITTGFHKPFSAGRQLTAQEQRAAKWFPAPLRQNWTLEQSQQLDRLVQHGTNTGRLLSSGNPGRVGEVEIGTLGGAGTCSRKAQNGAAKIEGWGGKTRRTHRAGGGEEERGQQEPCPCELSLRTPGQRWWQRSNEYHNIWSETCKYTIKREGDQSYTQIHKREIKSRATPLAAGAALVSMERNACSQRSCAVPIGTTSARNRASFKANTEKSLTHNFI